MVQTFLGPWGWRPSLGEWQMYLQKWTAGPEEVEWGVKMVINLDNGHNDYMACYS